VQHVERAGTGHRRHGMQTMHITETGEFRKVDRMAVVAWKRKMEQDGAKPRTVRRRLSALSSLFSHLVDKHVVDSNPVREIRRPRVNRKQGTTPAFSPAQARELLDAPGSGNAAGSPRPRHRPVGRPTPRGGRRPEGQRLPPERRLASQHSTSSARVGKIIRFRRRPNVSACTWKRPAMQDLARFRDNHASS